MYRLRFFSLMIFFLSCSKGQTSLGPLKTDLIGDIPAIVNVKKLKSIYYIMVKGQINGSKAGDTVSSYIMTDENSVKEFSRLKGGITVTYKFNDSGLVASQKSNFSDQVFAYTRKDNRITMTASPNKNDSSQTVFKVKGNRLTEKITSFPICFISQKYFYDSKRQLVRTLNDHRCGDTMLTEKRFIWKGRKLTRTISKDLTNSNEESIEAIVEFDNDGIPKRKIYLNCPKRDTMAILRAIINKR